ncbi:cytochrome c, 26 heme-binding sites [Geotalea daltonii FRC-32]|uniref:Cytochrome c, 26 heme-binding sites n=2 Tax=Geotalea TaxID=2910589 RepID=B9M7X2_GEODF|nr:cytochrome c, 26 heme-binding sites [Geotalea daltonii FRC-32]
MGKTIVRKIRGVSLRAKIALIAGFTMLLSTFMYQGWYRPVVASATEMVSNGVFNGSAGWTFSTATYDSTTTRTASSGSAKLSISGRNTATIGTVTQAVSIPAGSTIDAVSLYAQLTTSHETTGDNISVDLRYSDATTVNILSSGELTNSSWTVSNGTGVTLAMDVNQVIITMNTKSGNNSASTASLWVDEVTVSYTAGLPCSLNIPTLAVSPSSSLVAAGANMLYTATVTNNDSGAGCSNVTFNLGLINTNTSDFTLTAISPASLLLPAGAQGTAEFTVTAQATAADGAVNTSTVSVSAFGHTAPPNATVQTTVNSGGSPLLHTSANLDPTNAKGYGTWGASYACSTCHNRNSTNVKRVLETIVTPLGSRPVLFSRMTASIANTQGTFGDDLRTTYANASRNVCEVCHHKTLYHQYSSTKIANRSTDPHYNRQDCAASCHPHSAGFKGSGCDGCHGNPPTSTATLVTSPEATLALGAPPTSGGSHSAHVTGEGMKCTTCHSGNTMPSVSKTIQIGFDINNSNWPGFAGPVAFGSFSGRSPLGGTPAYSFVSSKTGTVVNTSASYRTSCNVYCHGQWTGANGSINPSWIVTDGSQSACGTCHAASAANVPATGKHTTHASSSAGNYGFSCTKCHPGASSFNHVNGSVQWRLSSSTTGLIGSTSSYSPAVTGADPAGISGNTNKLAPSATYGTCTNIYCHSNAQSNTGAATPVAYTSPGWNDASLGCGGCHLDMDTNASATGDHVKHAQTYAISCVTCHNGYTETSVTTATHVNKVIEISFSGNGAGTTYSQANQAPGNGYGTCSTSYCHSTAQSSTGGATPTYPGTAPTWGSSTMNCGSCHLNMDSNTSAPGDHVKHAQGTANFTCATCHNGYTETSVTTSTHVNKTIELSFSGTYATGTVYSQGNGAVGNGFGNCTASKCHGQGAPVWGGGLYSATVPCENCHGSAATSPFYSTAATGAAPTKVTAENDSKVGAHVPHLTARAAYTGIVACGDCHTVPATITAVGHMNGVSAPVFSGDAVLNTANPTYASSTCTATYCHGGKMINGSSNGSDTSPTWTNTAYLTGTPSNTGDCAMCHGCPPTGYTGSSHSGTEALSACNGCHSHVNADGTFTAGANRALHINGIVEASGGDCLGCHAGLKNNTGNADIDNNGVRIITAEFSRTSHHVTGVTLTVRHCAMCHMEGDTSGVKGTLHENGQIDLRNVDTNTAIVWTGSEHANMDNFCFACHDNNGVNNTTVQSITGGTATNPFNDTLRNSYDQVTRPGVIDVKTQFTTTNYSHHAVSGQKYTSSTPLFSASPNRFVSTFTPLGGSVSIRDTSTIHCGDCHTSGKWATSGGIGAHGSTNEYMLQTASGTDTTHTSTDYVCFKCHVGSIYNDLGGKTLGGTAAHITGGNGSDYTHTAGTTGLSARTNGDGHITGMTCSGCHNCGQTGWGGIHGGNASYTDGNNTSQQTRRFMPGMGNSKYIPGGWTSGTGATCYTLNNSSWSTCNQHPSGGKSVTRTPRAITY